MLKTRKKLLARIKDLQKRLDRVAVLKARWENLCEKAGVEWAPGDVDTVKRALGDIRHEVRSGKKALRIVKRREGKSKRMTRAVESAAEQLQERQAVLREKESEVTLHRKLLTVIEQESAELAAQENALAASLLRSIGEFGEKVPAPGAEDAFLLNIAVRSADYRTQQERLAALGLAAEDLAVRAGRLPETLKSLTSEAEALEARIEAQQKQLNLLKKEREDRFGKDDPVRKQQALAARIGASTASRERLLAQTDQTSAALFAATRDREEVEAAYQRAKTASDTVDRLLKNKVIAASVFRNVDDVRESFMPAAEKEIIEAHVARVEEEIRQCRATLEKLKISSAQPLSERSAAAVDLAIDDTEKKLDLLKNDLDRLTGQYAEVQEAEALYQEEQKALDALRERFDELNILKAAIETGDDVRVRKGFHEEMFRKLLEKAGGYAGMLNDRRYAVRQSDNDPFGLEVEVPQNGGTVRRPVESLSGGETFLISLSMALALSDLTGGSRRIQSLFIDEGFGSLDDENLTQVINTLNDHLKANGKRVGVISHVSRLDEEFQTKIQLIPERGGKTRLEVLPKETPREARGPA